MLRNGCILELLTGLLFDFSGDFCFFRTFFDELFNFLADPFLDLERLFPLRDDVDEKFLRSFLLGDMRRLFLLEERPLL